MIAAGEEAVRNGDFQSHEDVMKEMDSWLGDTQGRYKLDTAPDSGFARLHPARRLHA